MEDREVLMYSNRVSEKSGGREENQYLGNYMKILQKCSKAELFR